MLRRLPPAIAQFVARPATERRIGPFLLLHQLGQGGFAPVWAARETYDDTDVRDAAVKLFALGRQANFAREQLIREARALCRVDHPHVVRFYSLVIDEPAGVGALAMELVAGQSLGARIREFGPLPATEVLQIGTALANALEDVHRAGLLHRDVKPDNVVESAGTYKLIDFGIAWPTEGEDEAESVAEPGQTARMGQHVTGTIGFVAPEYLHGEPPSISGELYAFGATLHTCLLGYPPAARTNAFPWDLDPDVLEGKRPAPAVNTRASDAPPILVDLIERLITPMPQHRPASAGWVAERLRAMAQDTSRRTKILPQEDAGPFRGLGRFEAEHRDVFFGRDGEIGSVLELLRRRSLVVLVGPSGSGKSSLARAGVLPRVAEGALEQWPQSWDTVIIAPGSDPRAAVVKSLSPWLGEEIPADVESLVDLLDDHVQNHGCGLLLFLDPLEELVTLESEGTAASRAFFVELLVRLGEATPEGVKVLGAARRDLLDPLLALPALGKTLARSFVLIEPLTPPALREVLAQALDAYGYRLEDDVLVDELLAGVETSANAMPLVAFALTEAWRMRDRAGKRITRAGLLAMGGVRGALEKHAEATLHKFVVDNIDKQEAARRMLLSLTTLEGTRAPKPLDKLRLAGGKHADEFVKVFVEARLCVPVEGGVTLAHEALITQWGRLDQWLDAARPARLVLAELERAARFWKTDPEVAPLIRGARLERIQSEVHGAEGEWLSDEARAYLTASVRAARRRRMGMGIGIGIGMASIAALVVGGAVGLQWFHSTKTAPQVERGLQAPRGSEKATVKATNLVEAPAVPRPLTTRDDAVSVIPVKTSEANKRGVTRNVAPKVQVSAEVQEKDLQEEPALVQEKVLQEEPAPVPIKALEMPSAVPMVTTTATGAPSPTSPWEFEPERTR